LDMPTACSVNRSIPAWSLPPPLGRVDVRSRGWRALGGLGSAGRGDLDHRPVDSSMTGRWMPATIPVPAGHSGRGRIALLARRRSVSKGCRSGRRPRPVPFTATPTVELPKARSRNLVANPPAGAAHARCHGRRHVVATGQGGRGAGAAPGGGGRPPARLPAGRSSRSPASRSPLPWFSRHRPGPDAREQGARGHHANGE
jgi:hypothetical protein